MLKSLTKQWHSKKQEVEEAVVSVEEVLIVEAVVVEGIGVVEVTEVEGAVVAVKEAGVRQEAATENSLN